MAIGCESMQILSAVAKCAASHVGVQSKEVHTAVHNRQTDIAIVDSVIRKTHIAHYASSQVRESIQCVHLLSSRFVGAALFPVSTKKRRYRKSGANFCDNSKNSRTLFVS